MLGVDRFATSETIEANYQILYDEVLVNFNAARNEYVGNEIAIKLVELNQARDKLLDPAARNSINIADINSKKNGSF